MNLTAEGLICPICKKVDFSSVEELLTHSEACMKSPALSEAGFICPECKEIFAEPDSLVTHVERVHTSESSNASRPSLIEREIDDLFGGQDILGMAGKDKEKNVTGEEEPWIDELKKHEEQFRRKQALIEFYKTREPSKLDSVDNILSNYAFRDVVASLKKTYGEVPSGWEKELGWFSTGKYSILLAFSGIF